MHGRSVMSPVWTRAADLSVPRELEIVQQAGRCQGLLVYVEYRAPSTLSYSELAFMPCRVRPRGQAGPTGYWVSAMYVDSELSLAAGRSEWALPKRIATFERRESRLQVRADDGLAVDLSLRVLPVGRRMRTRVATLQTRDGEVLRFRGDFDTKVAPATLHVTRFTRGDEGWQGFRGRRRVPRPAAALLDFRATMLEPDFPLRRTSAPNSGADGVWVEA